MTRTKICYIVPSVKMLGASISLLQLLEYLDRDKIAPFMVCPETGGLEEEVRKIDIPVAILPIKCYRKFKNFPLRPYIRHYLHKLHKREQFDIVHCNEFWVLPYANYLKKAFGIPIVCHIRGPITQRRIKNYKLKHADRIICISEGVRNYLVEDSLKSSKIKTIYNGVKINRFDEVKNCPEPQPMSNCCIETEYVKTIYNGVKTTEFSKSCRNSKLRKEFGLSPDDILIGLVGRITKRKGHHFLIEALKRTTNSNNHVKLVFIGKAYDHDEEYMTHLNRLIEENGLRERIIFAGYCDPVAEAMAACDIIALPSTSEGLGRVLIEGMALRLPTIGFDAEGINEVIADGLTGFVVPKENVSELARALDQLVQDKNMRIEMGIAGRKRLEELFTIERHAAQVQELYDELLIENSDT